MAGINRPTCCLRCCLLSLHLPCRSSLFLHRQCSQFRYFSGSVCFFPFRSVLCFTGTNNRRHLIFWKYNSSGCLTTLKNRCAMESLTYSKYSKDIRVFCPNGPFPSPLQSLFQSESKCEIFVMVISSNFNMNKNRFS